MKIVAVTACLTGIAHTYMAADALVKAASKHKIDIKVETQGALGIENQLNPIDILQADKVFFVSKIEIEQYERFEGKNIIFLDIEDVLLHVDKVLSIHSR